MVVGTCTHNSNAALLASIPSPKVRGRGINSSKPALISCVCDEESEARRNHTGAKKSKTCSHARNDSYLQSRCRAQNDWCLLLPDECPTLLLMSLKNKWRNSQMSLYSLLAWRSWSRSNNATERWFGDGLCIPKSHASFPPCRSCQYNSRDATVELGRKLWGQQKNVHKKNYILS